MVLLTPKKKTFPSGRRPGLAPSSCHLGDSRVPPDVPRAPWEPANRPPQCIYIYSMTWSICIVMSLNRETSQRPPFTGSGNRPDMTNKHWLWVPLLKYTSLWKRGPHLKTQLLAIRVTTTSAGGVGQQKNKQGSSASGAWRCFCWSSS